MQQLSGDAGRGTGRQNALLPGVAPGAAPGGARERPAAGARGRPAQPDVLAGAAYPGAHERGGAGGVVAGQPEPVSAPVALGAPRRHPRAGDVSAGAALGLGAGRRAALGARAGHGAVLALGLARVAGRPERRGGQAAGDDLQRQVGNPRWGRHRPRHRALPPRPDPDAGLGRRCGGAYRQGAGGVERAGGWPVPRGEPPAPRRTGEPRYLFPRLVAAPLRALSAAGRRGRCHRLQRPPAVAPRGADVGAASAGR